MSKQSNLTDRVIFWVLGTALFLSIGLLPNVLYSRYLNGMTVHIYTYLTVAVIFLLLWIASKYRASDSK
jgi:hypothetical protein